MSSSRQKDNLNCSDGGLLRTETMMWRTSRKWIMTIMMSTTTTMVILMEEYMNEAEGDDYNNNGDVDG